jgi:hypothetical protein
LIVKVIGRNNYLSLLPVMQLVLNYFNVHPN